MSLPDRLVESGFVLSVLVSAIHPIRPLLRREEIYVGAGFGLVHGLAFAALLGRLDLSRGGLVATLFGVNLGIELTQLLLVVAFGGAIAPADEHHQGLPGHPRRCRRAGGRAGRRLARAENWDLGGEPLEPVAIVLVDHPMMLAAALGILGLGPPSRNIHADPSLGGTRIWHFKACCSRSAGAAAERSTGAGSEQPRRRTRSSGLSPT